MIHAPFSDDQVASLENYQRSDFNHPFTCPDCGMVLTPTRAGWRCPDRKCGARRNWAWRFMADWSWRDRIDGILRLLALPVDSRELEAVELDPRVAE